MATRAVADAAVRAAAGAARAAAAPAGGLAIPTGSCRALAAATAASAAAATGGGRRWWPATGAPGGRAGLASASGVPPTPVPIPSHPSPSTTVPGASLAADANTAATTTPGDADPQATSLRTAIAATTDALMRAGWTNTEEDVDELWVMVEDGDATLDAYRPLYAAGAGAATHPATYAAFETFHRTKQALELTLLFEATTTRLMREHMDMTGVLGSNTAVPPDASATLNRALNEYIDFVRAISDSSTDALRAKVEAELGAKVLQLRAVPSVGDSETRRNVSVAGDHILTDHVTTSIMDVSGRRARRAAAAAGQA
ncbi:hypothetical protein MMPV_000332 [Pyropia vietnamensis]